jgi:hypothetical protein
VGLDVGSKEMLTNLRFADDVVLVARTLPQAERMLRDLAEAAAVRGLELHIGKTKILSNSKRRKGLNARKSVEISGKKVEVLPIDGSTKYLGRAVCFDNFTRAEVESRIAAAWRKFHANRDVLCNSHYPLKQRVKLFDAIITPTALYGSASWVMTQELESCLKKAQRRMLRSIYQRPRRCYYSDNLTDSDESARISVAPEKGDEELEPWVDWIRRVTHEIEENLERAGLEDWVLTQRRRKFRWAGHVCRRDDGRWSTRLLMWQPEAGPRQGGKGRGRQQSRPKRRWEDSLVKFMDCFSNPCDWKFIAHSRDEWQKLEEAYIKMDWT